MLHEENIFAVSNCGLKWVSLIKLPSPLFERKLTKCKIKSLHSLYFLTCYEGLYAIWNFAVFTTGV